MKKVLSIILSISLLLTLANTYVFAENDNWRENEHFFVKTIVCPNDYIEYANSNIISFLESHCENGVPNVKIKLGSPFTFLDEGSDVYYFPVMFDDVIRYIFRVYPNRNIYKWKKTVCLSFFWICSQSFCSMLFFYSSFLYAVHKNGDWYKKYIEIYYICIKNIKKINISWQKIQELIK